MITTPPPTNDSRSRSYPKARVLHRHWITGHKSAREVVEFELSADLGLDDANPMVTGKATMVITLDHDGLPASFSDDPKRMLSPELYVALVP
jgi:hypothetical protein